MSSDEPRTELLFAGIRSYFLDAIKDEGMKVVLLDDRTV